MPEVTKPPKALAVRKPQPPVVAAPPVIAPTTTTVPTTLAAPVATPAITPIAAAVEAAAPTVKDPTMTNMNRAAETMTAKAGAAFAEANDRAKSTFDKGQKLAGEMNDFAKGNVDALVESARIAARGLEAMGQDAAAYARQSFERTSATVRQLASVKSPTELLQLQSDYVRGSFDALVAEGSRSTEAMLKLAGEIAQPLSNRMALAAEKVKQAA